MSQTPSSAATDQAYTKGRVKLVICTIHAAAPPVIGSLLKLLQSQSAVDYVKVTNAPAITDAIRSVDRAIVVLTLTDKEEILSVLNFLKAEEARISQGTLRIIVLNRMNHPKILNALKVAGVNEILEFHVTIKALNLKIKNQMLLLNQVFERMLREERRAAGTEATAAADQRRAETAPQIFWEPAFEHPNDFWILTSKKNARFVMGRWLIELLGPGPSTGAWESTDLTWRGEIGWQWKPRDPNHRTFQREAGAWVFFGRVPEFVWQKNLWSFVGKFPSMAFYRDGKAVFYRLKCEQNQIVLMRENSESAKDMLEDIKATMETSLRLNEELKSNDGFNVSLGRDSSNRTAAKASAAVNLERPDAKALGFLHGTSSNSAPSPAWQAHMESEGVDLGKNGLSVPRDVPKNGWGGSSLLEPTTGGRALGLIDLSMTGARTDASVFETLQLTIELRSRGGATLAYPAECRLVDYRDGEVLFDSPVGICTKNEAVGFRAQLALGTRKSDVEVFGQVTLTDVVNAEAARESQRMLLAVQLAPEFRKRFESIIQVFQERQIEMNHFFRMARGA